MSGQARPGQAGSGYPVGLASTNPSQFARSRKAVEHTRTTHEPAGWVWHVLAGATSGGQAVRKREHRHRPPSRLSHRGHYRWVGRPRRKSPWSAHARGCNDDVDGRLRRPQAHRHGSSLRLIGRADLVPAYTPTVVKERPWDLAYIERSHE